MSIARPLKVIAFLMVGLIVHRAALAEVDVAQIAIREGLDPVLLYAVALAESARPVGKNRIVAWPWTIRSSRYGPKFFSSREQAEKHLQQLLSEGVESIDVGPMQINLKYHRDKVSDPLSLLDPVRNLAVGAKILRQALESSGDLIVAVGRYHSWDTAKAYVYGYRVWKIYDALQYYRLF